MLLHFEIMTGDYADVASRALGGLRCSRATPGTKINSGQAKKEKHFVEDKNFNAESFVTGRYILAYT